MEACSHCRWGGLDEAARPPSLPAQATILAFQLSLHACPPPPCCLGPLLARPGWRAAAAMRIHELPDELLLLIFDCLGDDVTAEQPRWALLRAQQPAALLPHPLPLAPSIPLLIPYEQAAL